MNTMPAPPEWITLNVKLHPDMADVIANFCHEHGARGVVLDDEHEEFSVVTAYFLADQWEPVHAAFRDYMYRLRDLFVGVSEPVVEISQLKHENWAIAWKDNFQSIRIGRRLLITPPWLQPDPEGREVIVIDPAEAFGTGTHETTQGCLELLEEAMDRLKATRDAVSVLDVGCGSGILAIAAHKLGASKVTAVDNDPVAVESALHNAELSGVAGKVDFQCVGLSDALEPADIITANLDTKTLMANQELLISLANRFLIVAGVPLDQWDDLLRSFLAQDGLTLGKELTRLEWGSGLFSRES
jgi:ribosomal protein L11 methyltransferase